MKNPFIKESNSGVWIAAAVTGMIAAGATAWYYIKRAGAKPEQANYSLEYLQPELPLHKKKADVHELHSIAAD